jgi:hypothetical protein
VLVYVIVHAATALLGHDEQILRMVVRGVVVVRADVHNLRDGENENSIYPN